MSDIARLHARAEEGRRAYAAAHAAWESAWRLSLDAAAGIQGHRRASEYEAAWGRYAAARDRAAGLETARDDALDAWLRDEWPYRDALKALGNPGDAP